MTKVRVKPIETFNLFDFKVVKTGKEVPPGCLAVLEGYATLSDDRSNKNRHFYPAGFWESILKDNQTVQEKLDTKTFFGSFRHPEKEESPIPEFGNISHNIREFRIDNQGVYVIVDVLNTRQGQELKPLIDYGSKLGISTRAYGEVEVDEEGYKTPRKDRYMFITWDLVSLPAFATTRLNKVSDSMEFEVDERVFTAKTKDEIVELMKSMPVEDARMLNDYMGFCSAGVQVADKTELETAFDQALDKIKTLESEIESLKLGDTTNVDLNNKLQVLQDENLRLRSDIEASFDKMEASRLVNAQKYLKERVRELEGTVAHLTQQNDMLKSMVSDKAETIKKFESSLVVLKDSIKSVEEENKILRSVNDQLELQVKTRGSKQDKKETTTNAGKFRAVPMMRPYSSSSVTDSDTEGLQVLFKKLKQ